MSLRPRAAALFLLCLAACKNPVFGPRDLRDSPTGNRRLVVLIVVDTLRDDFVDPASMPRTLAALSGARRFSDSRANSSWTLPSLASAFTSRPVLELTSSDGSLIGIPPAETTLAERLHDAGFATAAFVANATLRSGNGFAQGFDRFETTGAVSDPPPDAQVILAKARSWIQEVGHAAGSAGGETRDAFVWIHLMEPHEPLRDHAGHGRVAVEARILAGRERAPTAEEAATFRDLYANEVTYLDLHLGAFLEALPADAIVVLVSDHGEMLGEGTAWGHGMTLYEPVLRVPFLFRTPGVSAGTDDRPAELLDLVPTLLGRLGIAAPADSLAGSDLLSAAPASREPRSRLASTFSAGPLRWAYRRGSLAVLAHFAPQHLELSGSRASAAPSPIVLLERDPLPNGIWTYDPTADPVAAHGRSLELAPAETIAEVAESFARDVGGLSPGIHAIVLGQPAGSAWEFAVYPGAELEVSRIDAASKIQVERSGERLRLRSPEAQSLAMIAFGPRTAVRPQNSEWSIGRQEVPPELSSPGLFLWRNWRQPVAQHPQAEILERLRALGYLR